jgi:syntaxin 18
MPVRLERANKSHILRSAQESLVEIAQLQNTLMSNLTNQKEQISLLTEDEYSAEDNVKGGNKELAKAAQRPSAARYTFFAASAISTFLVLWDLFV